MIPRRPLLAAGLLAPLAAPAIAQPQWPERTVRVIVPWPPGGSTDVLGRIMAERLQAVTGQSFVVENRSGAAGNIGAEAIARSAPDGYTMGPLTLTVWAIHMFLYDRMPFNPDTDLQPISMHWELPNVLAVPTQHVPARTAREFIEWAKGRRQGVSYGSPGVGTSPHLSGALFASRNALDATHVPFRGAAQTIPAMLSGDVHFAVDNLASYSAIIRDNGGIRALAVATTERWPTLPEVPTMAEAGIADFAFGPWHMWAAPAGTPRAVTERLSQEIRAAWADPALQQRAITIGTKLTGSTPDELAARLQKEKPLWAEMVRITGAKAE